VGIRKYTGVVIVTYQMHVEVEAYDKNSAEDKMIDEYLTNSHTAHGDIEVKFIDAKEVTSA